MATQNYDGWKITYTIGRDSLADIPADLFEERLTGRLSEEYPGAEIIVRTEPSIAGSPVSAVRGVEDDGSEIERDAAWIGNDLFDRLCGELA
jgi:riboflavin synthase